MKSQPVVIPPHGGYRNLKSYQTAEIIYDATAIFCDRFIDRRSRTHDQMVQAARSGNKNIAEGSQVSGTSKKMELKLVGVARATLVSLSSDFFEVPEAWLPSAMFCTPLRAACTIWSWVRLRRSMQRLQNRTVTS